MNFSRQDVNALFALVPLVLWQLPSATTARSRELYEMQRKKHNVRIALPGYVFGPIWLTLYGFIIASGFLFFRDYESPHTPFYLPTCILYLVNVLLNKLWPLTFFSLTRNGRRYALVILIVLLLSGAAVSILQGLAGALLPALLYAVYLGWLVYALVLNVKWLWVPPCLRAANETSHHHHHHPSVETKNDHTGGGGGAKYRSAKLRPAPMRIPTQVSAPSSAPSLSSAASSSSSSSSSSSPSTRKGIPRFNIKVK